MLALIKELLYNRRYTIEGVQKLFKNRSLKDILGTEIQRDFFEEDVVNSDSSIDDKLQDTVKEAVSQLQNIKNELLEIAKAI